jgi:hypothetical protein
MIFRVSNKEAAEWRSKLIKIQRDFLESKPGGYVLSERPREECFGSRQWRVDAVWSPEMLCCKLQNIGPNIIIPAMCNHHIIA